MSNEKKCVKFKRVGRSFLRDEQDNVDIDLDMSLYVSEIKTYYCPFKMNCETCSTKEDWKKDCRRDCLSIESELMFRNYDSPTEFSLGLYKEDFPLAGKNLESIDNLIKFLQVYKTNYENAIDLMRESLEYEKAYQEREKVSKSSQNNDGDNSN